MTTALFVFPSQGSLWRSSTKFDITLCLMWSLTCAGRHALLLEEIKLKKTRRIPLLVSLPWTLCVWLSCSLPWMGSIAALLTSEMPISMDSLRWRFLSELAPSLEIGMENPHHSQGIVWSPLEWRAISQTSGRKIGKNGIQAIVFWLKSIDKWYRGSLWVHHNLRGWCPRIW